MLDFTSATREGPPSWSINSSSVFGGRLLPSDSIVPIRSDFRLNKVSTISALVIFRLSTITEHRTRISFEWNSEVSSYSVARRSVHLSWWCVSPVDRLPCLVVRESQRRYAVDEETRLRSEGFRNCFHDHYCEYLPMDCYCSGLDVSSWPGVYSIERRMNNSRHRNHRNSRSYHRRSIVWSYVDVLIYAFYQNSPFRRQPVALNQRSTSTWLVPHRMENVFPQNFESHPYEKNHPIIRHPLCLVSHLAVETKSFNSPNSSNCSKVFASPVDCKPITTH